jgi:formylglycine-generating enzyme required for sulfatase activity
MGSDKHYPEEAPVHSVTVDGFWMDRTPVTNREFRKFVAATGYVTFAEIPPDPLDYPDALPHMLKGGSLVFSPPDLESFDQQIAQLGLFGPACAISNLTLTGQLPINGLSILTDC